MSSGVTTKKSKREESPSGLNQGNLRVEQKQPAFFDPSSFGIDLWIELIVLNNLSNCDLLNFSLTCRYFATILAHEKTQKFLFSRKKTGRYSILKNQDIFDLRWSPDGRIIACSSSTAIHFFDTRSAKEIDRIDTVITGSAILAFHPNGMVLAMSNDSIEIMFYNLISKDRKIKVRSEVAVDDLKFSANGKWLSVCGENLISLWESDSGKHVHNFRGSGKYIQTLAFPSDPDLDFLISGGGDKVVSIWDIKTGKQKKTLQSPYPVSEVMISHNNKLVAAICGGFAVGVVWDIEAERVVKSFDFWCYSGCFALNSRFFFGSESFNVFAFDLKAPDKPPFPIETVGQNSWTHQRLSPDGNFLALISSSPFFVVCDVTKFNDHEI